MSDFITICNQVNTIVGMQGTVSDVESPVGIQRNIVEAVRSSWFDIQNMREDWTFMQGSNTSFSTTIDQTTYTPLEVFGSATAALDLGTYKRKRGIFLDQRPLAFVDFEDLPFIDNTTSTKPHWYSINAGTNNLIFELPDDVYTMDIRYVRAPQVLTASTDTPFIPSRYHNAITYKSVEKVAGYIGNAALFQEYSVEGNKVLGEMTREYIKARRMYPPSFI